MTAPGRRMQVAGVALASLALVAVIAGWGGPHDPARGLLVVLYSLFGGGWAAGMYLLAGIGLGTLVAPMLRGAPGAVAVQSAFGLALILAVSHGLGVAGLLQPPAGRVMALVPVVLGLVLLARRLARVAQPWARPVSPLVVLLLPATAVLVVAASNPPGWLWDSEFGGFDALSYHLQLPREWLEQGRLWPVRHNVYSFLPGYVEAAFMHVAVLGGWSGSAGGPPLVAGEGLGLIAAQLLHAMLTVTAAGMVAAVTRRAAAVVTTDARVGGWAAMFAAALYLSTPWSVVTGSLAYNEQAVCALAAGALLAIMMCGPAPAVRGALGGWLFGSAICAKPSVVVLLGPIVLLTLLVHGGRGRWSRLVPAFVVGLAIAVAPWLTRNALAAGQPVFPLATSLFGSAHWTGEQVARYTAAHSFDGSLLDRLRLLVLPDPTDPAGPRHRGLLHPQWCVLFPVAGGACLLLLIPRPGRSGAATARRQERQLGWTLTAGLVLGVALWLTFTHIQSRFLLPLLVPACMAFGVALARGAPAATARREAVRRLVPVTIVLVQTAALVVQYSQQRGGQPNALLVPGPAFFTGAGAPRDLAPLTPVQGINRRTPPDAVVYLLGSSTPLYVLRDVVYATTWDTPPMLQVGGNDARGWPDALRQLGVTHLWVDFAELSRLRRVGWLHPALTPVTIRLLLEALGPPMMNWPELDSSLYRVPRPGR